MNKYTIKRTSVVPEMNLKWSDAPWDKAEVAEISNLWQGEGVLDFVPTVHAKILHDEEFVYGIYEVKDHYVKANHNGFQDNVCQDSCCEFFFQPSEKGYFNLEMNCGANFLCFYVRDAERSEKGFKDFSALTKEECDMIEVVSDLPRIVDPEITEPTTWHVQFKFPRALMEKYAGKLGTFSGAKWRGNMYKCADLTSHPHWIAWNPVKVLNFHTPDTYGDFILE